MNLLHSMSHAYLLDNKTVTPLFHAVSPMVRSKGCLIWYLPQHHSVVIETLAQLQTFLPSFEAPPDNPLHSSISSQHAGGEDIPHPSKPRVRPMLGKAPYGARACQALLNWHGQPTPAQHIIKSPMFFHSQHQSVYAN